MANGQYLHETYPVERGVQRFRELIIYISKQCSEDPTFGAVKLNKILYHSDFTAFEKFGVPLTGMRYFKLRQGPAPKALVPTRRKLIEEGAISLEGPSDPNDIGYHRTVARREPIMQFFTPDEVEIVDHFIEVLWGQSAREVSDASHDVRWRVVNLRDAMPYEFAHLDTSPLSRAEQDRTRVLAAELGW
ncbi:hypothetical protein PARHAE_02053 [Paracoccus haematequi]|uniref:Antitoxin SocA-like Panacea domain-containing protein n=1 Tax=Paracoccus haematequi TaxID=2491866 RepID=A0A447IMZ4_9RHOB|nr:Panacea domain-containing protein [Paracoccus haematequi]VDS08868.1 hypothetical protein PARHAE_02053 [Paracoccus haematequi]